MAKQPLALALEPASPWHLGAGRRGMVAQTHRFLPGHVLLLALACQRGRQAGGQAADFEHALETLQQTLQPGPFLVEDPEHGRALAPVHERKHIEWLCLTGTDHTALGLEGRAAIEGTLHQVEALTPRYLRGAARGRPVRYRGVLWYEDTTLAPASLIDELHHLQIGGEGKYGLGRLHRVERLDPAAALGWGRIEAEGLRLAPGERLPGPALDGVTATPWTPWTGRRFDPEAGFGRRMSAPALVGLDGLSTGEQVFRPATGSEAGLCCWTNIEGD